MFEKIESRKDIIVIVAIVFSLLLFCIGLIKVFTDMSSLVYITYISMMILSISIISILLVRKDQTKNLYKNSYLVVIGISIISIIIIIASLKDIETMMRFSIIIFPLSCVVLWGSFIKDIVVNRKNKNNKIKNEEIEKEKIL